MDGDRVPGRQYSRGQSNPEPMDTGHILLLIHTFAVIERDILKSCYTLPDDYNTQMEAVSITYWGQCKANRNHQQIHPD